MATLNWLHLSDWHQRGPDFDRKVVRDALLKDIRNHAAKGKVRWRSFGLARSFPSGYTTFIPS